MNTGNISIKASVSGNTPGLKGEKGNGIKSTVLNDDYSLTFNYTNGTSDTTPPIRGQKGEKGDNGISPSITTSKSGKVTTITIKDATGTKVATINDGVDSQGDMLKSTYDKNSNGIVDNSEKVNGHTVESNVPANAKFTDTIYSHPINSGNKHIPTGGSSGQILKWEEDGTAKWDDSIEAHREGTELKVNNYKQLIKFTKEGKTEQKTYTGKNLFYDTPSSTTSNGITLTKNSDGSFTLNGTTTGVSIFDFRLPKALPAGTYTFSIESSDNIPGDVFLRARDNNWAMVETQSQVNGNNTTQNSHTFTCKKDISIVAINITRAGITFNNFVIYPQLEKGTTATKFEPYVGATPSPNPNYPQEIKNVRGVENLLKLPDGTYDNNGITAVIKDGVITLNGTATARSMITISLSTFKSGSYRIAANNEQTIGAADDSSDFVACRIAYTDGYVLRDCYLGKKNSSGNFTLSSDRNLNFIIRTAQGMTYNNFVIKPQLEEGQIAHNFVPNGSNYLQLKNTTDNEPKIINIDLKGNELCSDKEQTLKDELLVENGKAKINKKFGEYIFTGNEIFSFADSNTRIKIGSNLLPQLANVYIPQPKTPSNITPSFCTHYILSSQDNVVKGSNKFAFSQWGNQKFIYFPADYSTIEEFKAKLKSLSDAGTPVKVQYELAEPEVVDLGEVDFDLIENSTLTCEEESDMQIDYLTIDSNIFVQDSLDGNSNQKAPSVNAVNEIISKLEARIIALENKNV